jgi:hypothetical protein
MVPDDIGKLMLGVVVPGIIKFCFHNRRNQAGFGRQNRFVAGFHKQGCISIANRSASHIVQNAAGAHRPVFTQTISDRVFLLVGIVLFPPRFFIPPTRRPGQRNFLENSHFADILISRDELSRINAASATITVFDGLHPAHIQAKIGSW